MFSDINSLVQALHSTAVSKGLSFSKPVMVTIEASNGSSVITVVSHDEPYKFNAPLNVFWLVSDPNSPNFLRLRKRSSRKKSAYYHTWVDILSISDFYIQQVWDTQKPGSQLEIEHRTTIGNPHGTTATDIDALPLAGGTMIGPLNLRASVTYGPSEAIPKSVLDASLAQVNATTQVLSNSFSDVYNRLDLVDSAIETLSQIRVKNGFTVAFNNQTEVTINHNLNQRVDASVYKPEGTKILPSAITRVSSNTLRIRFAREVTGFVDVFPVGE